ncbi:PIN-like domain-containing protein [Rhizobium rhizophilum]|uniref:PIN like domain-containing protein n=1 Tax=Rhizobium rhizophilum TaxID=1850373 RepID=A0ABY2R0M4_9HYPH|nr:PIN-like domain-containing protein [Rhizobium rhizophilum]THV16729.1 hypothetical protein E9677_01620 [Rhizobium rhizophilum]
MADGSTPQSSIAQLLQTLNRQREIPALQCLALAIKGASANLELASSAIVLDANVFLRIPSHRKSSDIMDYLVGLHEKPVVVPGQVIQEFWNNQLSAIDTIFKSVSKKHTEMSREIDRYKQSGVSGIDSVASALDYFKETNEHIFEPELVSKTSAFLERLVEKALVPYAPRSTLVEVAADRKKAKTPPGFKDEGSGDFLVWADLLFGLLDAKAAGASFDNVILLSHDAKPDWSRGKIAHPVLTAEVRALLDAHFEIWTLDQFAEAIGAA